MRAEDVLPHIQALDVAMLGSDTYEQFMTGEGVAFDEVGRFAALGMFRAEHHTESAQAVEDTLGVEGVKDFANAQLWVDGFLVGRRMMLAEAAEMVDRLIDSRLQHALDEVLRKYGPPPAR